MWMYQINHQFSPTQPRCWFQLSEMNSRNVDFFQIGKNSISLAARNNFCGIYGKASKPTAMSSLKNKSLSSGRKDTPDILGRIQMFWVNIKTSLRLNYRCLGCRKGKVPWPSILRLPCNWSDCLRHGSVQLFALAYVKADFDQAVAAASRWRSIYCGFHVSCCPFCL